MNSHGGRRVGAGRKPLPEQERKVAHTIYIKPETDTYFKPYIEMGYTVGQVIDLIIKSWREKVTHEYM